MPVILATQEAEIRRIADQSQPRQIIHETLSYECPTQKWLAGVAQVVEHLPSKHEALSTNKTNKNHRSVLKKQMELKFNNIPHFAQCI
jgi:hypothetical protein